MSPSSIEADIIRRFRAGRADGLSAAAAYRQAVTSEPTLAYECCGDDAVRFLIDDSELVGLEIIATATPDDDPDRSWLGEYTNAWSPDVVTRDPSAPRYLPRYFLPCHTVAQRRAALSALGYARGPAQAEAERQVREDARLFTELDARIVTVSVRKGGVLVGEASVGADFGPDAGFEDQLVNFASALVLDEAITEARAAMANPIAHGQQSHTPPAAAAACGTPIVVGGALWGSLRAEQADSGHTVLHIDPADSETKVRVLLGDAELADDRIIREDIEVAVCRGERDDRRVVHIDTFDQTGPIRINLNDGPAVYHGDPATGERYTEYTDF